MRRTEGWIAALELSCSLLSSVFAAGARHAGGFFCVPRQAL
jgi:hypothetical protein